MPDRPSLKRSVEIDAPIDEVFAYYTEPNNMPEYWPSVVEVRDVQRDGDRPAKFAWTYKMAGVNFDGETRFTEYEPNRRVVMESSGGIKSTNVIEFSSDGNQTRIDEELSYEIPVPLVGRFAEGFLLKLNANEFATIHGNVKARMESAGAGRG